MTSNRFCPLDGRHDLLRLDRGGPLLLLACGLADHGLIVAANELPASLLVLPRLGCICSGSTSLLALRVGELILHYHVKGLCAVAVVLLKHFLQLLRIGQAY